MNEIESSLSVYHFGILDSLKGEMDFNQIKIDISFLFHISYYQMNYQ